MNSKRSLKCRLRPLYKSNSLCMPANTRGFLQKICFKRTATIDMTQYGFISKASPINFLLRPLKDTLEKICGPSDKCDKMSQAKTTATAISTKGRKGLGKLNKVAVQTSDNLISMEELIKTQAAIKQRDQANLEKLEDANQDGNPKSPAGTRKRKKATSRNTRRVSKKGRTLNVKEQQSERNPSNNKEVRKKPVKKVTNDVIITRVEPAASRERRIKFSANGPEILGRNSYMGFDE